MHMLHLAYIRDVFSNSSGTVCTLCGPINTKLNLQVLLTAKALQPPQAPRVLILCK